MGISACCTMKGRAHSPHTVNIRLEVASSTLVFLLISTTAAAHAPMKSSVGHILNKAVAVRALATRSADLCGLWFRRSRSGR